MICCDCGKKVSYEEAKSHTCKKVYGLGEQLIKFYIYLHTQKSVKKISVEEVISKFEEIFPEIGERGKVNAIY